jgi:P27 family predicted phage terminase small subunit
MYAELQARRDFCLATLEAEGLTVPTRGGAEVVHPVFRVLKDTEARLLSLAAALGLTPEARLRLGLVAVEGRSKLQAFIDSQDAAE